MDYFGILKRAYHITIKNKFLWIFGILAGGAGGMRGFNFGSGFSGNEQDFQKLSDSFNSFDFNAFWSHYGVLILGIFGFLVILGLVLAVVSIICQGALVGSVDKIEKNEKTDFVTGWKIGWHQFWRIFALGLIFALAVFVSLTILIVPVIIFVVTSLIPLAIVWGILFFLVCLFFWIVISIISPYALRVLVLENVGIIESIKRALKLLRHRFGNIVIMYLLLMVVGMAVGVGLVIAILFVLGIFVLLGLGLWLINPIPAIIFWVIAGTCFVVAWVIFSGAYQAYYSSVITLTYREIIK